MHPPPQKKKNPTKLSFSELLEILNTKSTVNIENKGMQTLFRQSIYRISVLVNRSATAI